MIDDKASAPRNTNLPKDPDKPNPNLMKPAEYREISPVGDHGRIRSTEKVIVTRRPADPEPPKRKP